MSKVSVIVPIYRVEKYIERCVESLFKQTLDDIEFIFVNDCTPDNSMDILNQLIKKYQSILAKKKYVIRIEQMLSNSGLAAVRKHGIQLATGDYIINCDSDDWTDIHMYEKMYNHAVYNDSDLVICDYIISDGNKDTEEIINRNITDLSKEVLFKKCLISSTMNPVWTSMAKRNLFKEMIYPLGDMSEDKIIMTQLIWHAKKVSYLPVALYYYFMSNNSIVRTINKDANIRKFRQLMDNKSVLLNFFKRENVRIPKKQLDAFLFSGKIGYIESYLDDIECKKLWYETYPLSICNVIFNPYISLKLRIKYFFTILKHTYRKGNLN